MDTLQKINIKTIDMSKSFKIIYNDISYKMGFTTRNDNIYNNIIADTFVDIRLLTKLNLYILNIQNDTPFGILNVNGRSLCEVNFINPVSLENFNIKFTTENNMDYDFNGVAYNLSFQIIIKD